jgi:hypothetical protein
MTKRCEAGLLLAGVWIGMCAFFIAVGYMAKWSWQ